MENTQQILKYHVEWQKFPSTYNSHSYMMMRIVINELINPLLHLLTNQLTNELVLMD